MINRGYSSSDFTTAVKILNKYNIDIVAHIMCGLPEENFEDIKNTVSFLNKHKINGIKIHSTYVVENTILADWYRNKTYTPITYNEYMDYLSYILSNINPNFVIHRITGDAPKDILIAPEWNIHKKKVLNGINKLIESKK